MLHVAMTPKGTSVQILGCLSLMLMSTCRATLRPNIFELILDSVKNIEDLVRDSSMHQPVYFISPAGRNGIVNSPYPLHPREIAVNFDRSEEEIVREHLHRHPKRPKSGKSILSQSSVSSSVNSNSNDNEFHGQIEDEAIFDRPNIRRFIDRAPGANRNGNTNSNSNSNKNGNERSSVDIDVPAKNTLVNDGPHYRADFSHATYPNGNVNNDYDYTNDMM